MGLGGLPHRSVVTILAGAIFVFWGTTAHLRCLDARNRRHLVAISGILATWMLLVVVRWQVPDGPARVLLWYAYYIPLAILPLLCLLCAARASGLDRRPWARAAQRALWGIGAALALLVLTNDVHEQVFRFLGETRSDDGPYAYVWGHRLIIAWSLICYLAFFTILLSHSRRRLKPAAIPVVVACLAGLAFSLSYGMRMPWASRLNFSLVYAALVAGTLELCLDLGLIASSRSFTPIFDSLPIDLKVVGRDGVVFRATRASGPLADDVRDQVMSLVCDPSEQDPAHPYAEALGWHGHSGKPAVFTLASHPGEAFHAWRLAGGFALLTQDTRDLDALTRALAARQDGLRRTNQMLERRRQTAGLLEELEAKRALMEEVEAALSASLAEIGQLFDRLSASDGYADARARRLNLRRARMLLGYCKRKSSLVLFEAADPELDRARIGLIANELAGDLRAVGIDCAAMVNLSRPISAHDMSILYDCIYDVALVAFSCADPVLLYFLGERADGMVELRAQLHSDDEDDLTLRQESATLSDLLAHRDVIYALTGGRGALRLVARARGRGGDQR